MKILTLNTHSLIEENYQEKLQKFAMIIQREQPDIIALQEVNQSVSAPLADPDRLTDYFPCQDNYVSIRQDNHAAQAAWLLHQAGLTYHWTWLALKLGYGKYDEGIALFSRQPITNTDSFRISLTSDYGNWKMRKVLGIQTQGRNDWFYTVHMGWWNDTEEPFQSQWKHLEFCLKEKKASGIVWLMGDFNSPAEIRAEGYDFIHCSGWKDTYLLAKQKDDGITVAGVIDGWRDKIKDSDSHTNRNGMRIDHIWCSQNVPVISSNIVFNGSNGPVVSDHFGLMIHTKGADES
ncbi:MAG: endonuclease/exonuclease/phosphatase family protein [Lachnospiraceae bacterium]|nr:endonuclease/exonuclease/phosphatase family protein [Lachnospiraceae bacterium]